MLATVERMDDYWFRQFPPTLRLIRSSPSLDGYTLRYCSEIQSELVRRLGRGETLELRLLVEMVVGAWRCALAEWPETGGRAELAKHVERAFAALPRSLTLS